MPFNELSLRKLLVIFGSNSKAQVSKLRTLKKQDAQKLAKPDIRAMDFHTPFWSDAKKHVTGAVDLTTASRHRAKDNKNRFRLYPLLAEGFLQWWNEKTRWTNEGYELASEKIGGNYTVSNGGIVKVDNFLHLKKGGSSSRLVYPYFSEKPPLQSENARLGLWLISQVAPDHALENLRILDVLRGKPFSIMEAKFTGQEKAEFEKKYAALKLTNDGL